MDYITIDNLKILATHGHYEHERHGQMACREFRLFVQTKLTTGYQQHLFYL
jgi:dihydroneopterin aldolase